MWEFSGLPMFDMGYFSSPDFLKAINDSVAAQLAAPVAPPVVAGIGSALTAPVNETVSPVAPAAGALGASAGFDASALQAAGLSAADISELANWSPSNLLVNPSWQSRQDAELASAQGSGISNVGNYVPVYGGADIIPGTTDFIFSKLGLENPIVPVFQTYGSQNSGNPLDVTERSTFAPTPGANYQLVDNATGEVLGTASSPSEIGALVQVANALSAEQGKSADWSLQQQWC